MQPKGRIIYEDGGSPNTGTHKMKTHTHTETRHSIFAIPHMMFVVDMICLTDWNESRQSLKRGSRQGSLQPMLEILSFIHMRSGSDAVAGLRVPVTASARLLF